MIRGVGVDIVGVRRFDAWLDDDAKLRRFFHIEEIDWALSQGQGAAASLAARFAAREAFGKALGTGIREFSLLDIHVKRDSLGRPSLELDGAAKQRFRESGARSIHLSLSHERDYAVAMVVLE